jgi:hypothetical protein
MRAAAAGPDAIRTGAPIGLGKRDGGTLVALAGALSPQLPTASVKAWGP